MEERLNATRAAEEQLDASRTAERADRPSVVVQPSAGATARYVERGEDSEAPQNRNSALPPSESTNVWPDEAAEAAFIAESRGRGEPPAVVAPPPVEDEKASQALPKLDDLVNRIPAESRELLDELFRAKFVTVRRVPKDVLKSTVT